MVKLVFLCRRRDDLDHRRFAELLLDGHVPLALRHHPAMRRYVVNVVEESAPGAPPLDSIGMLWFDSLVDFRERLYDSAEGERVIVADVARFMGGAEAYATVEQDATAGPPAGGDGVVLCLGGMTGATRFRDAVVSRVARRLSQTGPGYDEVVELRGVSLPSALAAASDAATLVHGYRVRAHVARW